MTSVPSPQLPWGIKDLRLTGLANLVGIIAVVAAWIGADTAGSVARQLTWSLIALAALVVMGVANCTWMVVGRRAVGLRRRRLLQPLSQAYRASAGDRLLAGPGELVFVLEMGLYHRRGCQLVAGKQFQSATREEHENSGRHPCGVCCP